MDEALTGGDGPAESSLNEHHFLVSRIPGQSVIEKVLEGQAQHPRRSFLQKLFGADPLAGGNHSWYKGAIGEIAVGRVLTSLGTEWTLLHAVPVGYKEADIDHVLIGPAGVFTINTKNHSGQSVWVAGQVLMVSGQKKPHLRNAEFEARRTANLLGRKVRGSVPVTAVIVIRDPKTLTIRERPIGAIVLSDRQLVQWLKSRPTVLNPHQVQLLVAAAVEPETWHSAPRQSKDPAVLHSAFVSLQKSVNRAKAIRAAWVLTAMLMLPLVVFPGLLGR